MQWRQTLKSNAGIDAEFFNSRLRLYEPIGPASQQQNNLLSSTSLPASNGFRSHVGKCRQNRAIEVLELKTPGFIISKDPLIVYFPGSMSLGLIPAITKSLRLLSTCRSFQKRGKYSRSRRCFTHWFGRLLHHRCLAGPYHHFGRWPRMVARRLYLGPKWQSTYI